MAKIMVSLKCPLCGTRFSYKKGDPPKCPRCISACLSPSKPRQKDPE